MEHAFFCSPKAAVFPLHAFGPKYSKQLFIGRAGGEEGAAKLSNKSPPLPPSPRILNGCAGRQVHFNQSSALPLQI